MDHAGDHLGLEEADDGFSQGLVVGVANTAVRWLNPRLGEALGIAEVRCGSRPCRKLKQPDLDERFVHFDAFAPRNPRTNPIHKTQNCAKKEPVSVLTALLH